MYKNCDQHTLSERSSIEDSGYSMDKESDCEKCRMVDEDIDI